MRIALFLVKALCPTIFANIDFDFGLKPMILMTDHALKHRKLKAIDLQELLNKNPSRRKKNSQSSWVDRAKI